MPLVSLLEHILNYPLKKEVDLLKGEVIKADLLSNAGQKIVPVIMAMAKWAIDGMEQAKNDHLAVE